MRIVHTADNHLDMPLSALSPEKARIRKIERRRSFQKIIEYTISSHAHMLLISGDLFDSPNPSEELVNFCRSEFERLNGTPVFISAGNHDYSLNLYDFPGNVHVFSDKLQTVSHPDFTVTGISFTSPSADFANLITPPEDKSKINILCLHGDIFTQSEYNPINKDIISSIGYDYIALGHIHTYSKFKNLVYPGTHDGGGFDEYGTKGFVVCDIEKDFSQVEFIPSSSRIYSVIDFDISAFKSSSAIASAISDILSDGIYKINLIGTPDKNLILNTEYIRSYLEQASFFVKVSDLTKADNDISDSEIYKCFLSHLEDNCPDDIRSLAVKYGTLALKGAQIDL